MARDLTRAQLAQALRAWAYFVGGGAETLREGVSLAIPWLEARWDAGDDHLPLTLVHDLGHLLLRGRDFRFASARDLASWPEPERAARMSYEDKVLGRWAVDPSVSEAHIAIAGMNARARTAAVAHAVGLALAGPLRAVDELATANPAHLRALAETLEKEVPERHDAWGELLPDEYWRQWAREQIDACVAVLPAAGRLFKPEDLWEIAHLERLPSDSARMALREVNTYASRVGPVSPTVALGIRRRAREVPVDAEEADQYPAGGFDAISTKGAFENLVRSEVAYVGEGAHDGIDLFDVRFAENELLFYTRDESPLLDARRDVVFVFDRPAEQRFKIASLPAQTLVLSQSLAFALQADLVRVFGSAGSKSKFLWVVEHDADREAAREEHQLLSFLLAAEVAHRRVELAVVEGWEQVPEAGRIVWSPRAEPTDQRRLSWVRVGQELWRVGEHTIDLREEGAARALADIVLLAIAKGEPRPMKKKKKPAQASASAKK
ncbi:MAG: hypothetical protein JNK05_14085 [Myxococcales bacterium]|nr:hypothetical protein [Myxococcales bacterium]